jgi:hypothetical protein
VLLLLLLLQLLLVLWRFPEILQPLLQQRVVWGEGGAASSAWDRRWVMGRR